MDGYQKFNTGNVTISVSSGEHGWIRLSLIHADVAAVSVDLSTALAWVISAALRQSANTAEAWQAEMTTAIMRELQGGAK